MCVNDTTTCWQTVGENRDKFYLSPKVCQHVVLSFTHTNFEFAVKSWPTLVWRVKAALNEYPPKNTCQISTQKNPGIENFEPQKILRSSPSLEIQSTPLGCRHSISRILIASLSKVISSYQAGTNKINKSVSNIVSWRCFFSACHLEGKRQGKKSPYSSKCLG